MDHEAAQRWPIAEFIMREGAGSPPAALPNVARRGTAPGEWVRLVGSAPAPLLFAPCVLLLFEGALAAGFYAYFIPRAAGDSGLEYAILAVLVAGAVCGFLILMWAISSSLVIVTDRRVILARRWPWRTEADIPHSGIDAVECRAVRVMGATMSRYELRLRTGQSRSLGVVDFVGVGP